MRSTQLQTLRAVAVGAATITELARYIGIPYSSAANRLRKLVRDGYLEARESVNLYSAASHYSLTDRARALLETRSRLDGETEPGLGYMQGKGAS